jgi:hypothetical protein
MHRMSWVLAAMLFSIAGACAFGLCEFVLSRRSRTVANLTHGRRRADPAFAEVERSASIAAEVTATSADPRAPQGAFFALCFLGAALFWAAVCWALLCKSGC